MKNRAYFKISATLHSAYIDDQQQRQVQKQPDLILCHFILVKRYYKIEKRYNKQERPKMTSPAPLWRRISAMVYDLLLISAVSMAYAAFMIGLEHLLSLPGLLASGVGFQLGWLAVVLGFFCFFWHRGGQTLGMRAWRLRIINQDNEQFASYRQCLLRCLFAPLGWLCFFTAYFNPHKSHLHEQVSQTRVVLLSKTQPGPVDVS